MAKTKMNFRLSDDALLSLARLSGLWGCDRTAVVERALSEADPSEMDLDERESTAATFEEVHGISEILPTGPISKSRAEQRREKFLSPEVQACIPPRRADPPPVDPGASGSVDDGHIRDAAAVTVRETSGGFVRREKIPKPDWMSKPVPGRSDFTPVPKGGKK